jgi:hypothetical protein
MVALDPKGKMPKRVCARELGDEAWQRCGLRRDQAADGERIPLPTERLRSIEQDVRTESLDEAAEVHTHLDKVTAQLDWIKQRRRSRV